MSNENNREILNGVQSQIGSFDNKASILLSVVGIVFAIAVSFLDVFHTEYFDNSSCCIKCCFTVLFYIFVIVASTSIFCFIMVIIPRINPKQEKFANYYKDITKMNDVELKERISDYFSKENQTFEQVKINANICMKKHIWLKIGLYLLIPFLVLLLTLIIFMSII